MAGEKPVGPIGRDRYGIVGFDPATASRTEWDAVHAFRRDRQQESRPDDPLVPDAEYEALLGRPDPFRESKRFAAVRRGAVVGILQAGRARPGAPGYEENRRFAHVWGAVLTAHRRQGLGTAFAREALTLMEAWDSDILTVGSEEEAGQAFLRWLGAEERSRGAENRLDLQEVDWAMVEDWARQGPDRSPQTRLVLYEDRIPEEALASYCPMLSALLNTMPFDRMEHGAIVVTPEMVQEAYARLSAVGGAHHAYVAVEPDGTIVGMTDVGFVPSQPDRIEQQFTGVHPDARGRGLGKWLKAAMLLYLRRTYPQARWIVTGNADTNAPMLAINRRLGFRTAHEGVTYQMSRDALARRLATVARGRVASAAAAPASAAGPIG